MIYAKTWCPAYPCDPCLIWTQNWTYDNSGSDFAQSEPSTAFCRADGSTGPAPHTVVLRQVNSYTLKPGVLPFLGVRKFGIPVQVFPGSNPLRFGFYVSGRMLGGVPKPASDLTIAYGGTVLLTVSGPIQNIVVSPIADVTPVGTFQSFQGLIEILGDDVILAHVFASGNIYEWTYARLVADPQKITINWTWTTDRYWRCDQVNLGGFIYRDQVYTIYEPYPYGWTDPRVVSFYGTKIDEMT
jgi:hypothetical protein